MANKRPNPALWLYYQFGGRLGVRYREWVLHDATSRTWLARALLRRLVQIAPVMAVLLLVLRGWLGGPWPVVLGSLLLGVLVLLRISLAYAAESVDSRLTRYGYPHGHASTLRREAAKAARAAEAERYNARYRRPTD